VTAKGVSNLIAKPGKDSNTNCQYPDVYNIWEIGGNDASSKDQRVAGNKRNEGANEQSGSSKN
jgi:hypothetical protein